MFSGICGQPAKPHVPSHWRDCHSAAPPSTFSLCFNRDSEVVSVRGGISTISGSAAHSCRYPQTVISASGPSALPPQTRVTNPLGAVAFQPLTSDTMTLLVGDAMHIFWRRGVSEHELHVAERLHVEGLRMRARWHMRRHRWRHRCRATERSKPGVRAASSGNQLDRVRADAEHAGLGSLALGPAAQLRSCRHAVSRRCRCTRAA